MIAWIVDHRQFLFKAGILFFYAAVVLGAFFLGNDQHEDDEF